MTGISTKATPTKRPRESARRPVRPGAALRHATRWLFAQRYSVPLTPLGLGLGLSAWWVYRHFGTEELDFVLYAAALVALLLLGLTVGVVLLVSGILWLRLRGQRGFDDLQLEAGTRAATGYSFPRFRGWPLVQVRLSWANPVGVEATMEQSGGRVQEVVEPSRRGETTAVRRRFIVSDIFGLARFGVTRRAEQRVRMLPGRARVSGHVISSFVGGAGLSHPSGPAEGDLSDMRRYAHGDPLRFVLWKAFARTRQLLVRTPERAIAPSPSVMAYYIAGKNDEPTAAAARLFLEQGLLGADFTLGTDGAAEPAQSAAEALELIVRSATTPAAEGGLGLGRFLDRADRARRRALILFFPPSPVPGSTAWQSTPRASVVPLQSARSTAGSRQKPPASPRAAHALIAAALDMAKTITTDHVQAALTELA